MKYWLLVSARSSFVPCILSLSSVSFGVNPRGETDLNDTRATRSS
jgi:hypothetical protein